MHKLQSYIEEIIILILIGNFARVVFILEAETDKMLLQEPLRIIKRCLHSFKIQLKVVAGALQLRVWPSLRHHDLGSHLSSLCTTIKGHVPSRSLKVYAAGALSIPIHFVAVTFASLLA